MRLDYLKNEELYRLHYTYPELLTVYSDGSVNYCNPNNPKKGQLVTVSLRAMTKKVYDVFLVVGDERISMKEATTDGFFSIYEGSFIASPGKNTYYFEFSTASGLYRYGKTKVVKYISENEYFEVIADFDIPKWAHGTKMYQIFTDRFYNGDKTNDVVSGEYSYIKRPVIKKDDWYGYPDSFDVCNFYGGDLKGVYEKLDYLQDLGVEVIYLNPIFVSPSNHKYDTQDYEHVDPHLGVIVNDLKEQHNYCNDSNENADLYKKRVTDTENLDASDSFFAFLVAEIHKRGMKVILDGVFNHCGSFNKWMDKEGLYLGQTPTPGAYMSQDSPYRDYFYFDEDDNTYLGWWNHDTLPKLRYEKGGALYNKILNIGKKWVSAPYNVDGWRLDVAADLGLDEETNRGFWSDFRKAVKEANPDAFLLAEHYGDAAPWLDGTMWDSIMNYDAFMEPISWFLTGVEKHSDYSDFSLKNNVEAFWNAITKAANKLPYVSLISSMNELSNHDHSRFLTRTNGICGRVSNLGPIAASANVNHAIMRAAVIMQFTWLGNPTIYYGDEAALCGFTDPDNRRCYPWGREDEIMLSFHKDVSVLYTKYSMLRTASLTRLACSDNALMCYARFDAKEQIIVVINNTDGEVSSEISLWQANITGDECLNRLICSYEIGYHKHPATYVANNGIINITITAHSSVILYHGDNYSPESEDGSESK